MSHMLKKSIQAFGILVFAGTLSGCAGQAAEFLGLEDRKPDEFAVVARAPLKVPDRFEVTTPDPEGQRTSDLAPQDSAARAVFGDDAIDRRASAEQRLRDVGASPSEVALLTEMNAVNVDPNIRRVVNAESDVIAAEADNLVEDLLFWRARPEPGDILDATEETRRLQGNNALGRNVNDGVSPVISREGETSWLDWPF